jgi:hypothetical protein
MVLFPDSQTESAGILSLAHSTHNTITSSIRLQLPNHASCPLNSPPVSPPLAYPQPSPQPPPRASIKPRPTILPQGVVNQDFVPAPIRKASMKTTSKKTLRKYENGAVNWDRAIFQGPSKELSAVRKAVYKRQKAERDMEVVLRVEEEMARKKEEKRVEEALGHVLRRWNGNETFDRYESGKRS